jgi:hypothetical protein
MRQEMRTIDSRTRPTDGIPWRRCGHPLTRVPRRMHGASVSVACAVLVFVLTPGSASSSAIEPTAVKASMRGLPPVSLPRGFVLLYVHTPHPNRVTWVARGGQLILGVGNDRFRYRCLGDGRAQTLDAAMARAVRARPRFGRPILGFRTQLLTLTARGRTGMLTATRQYESELADEGQELIRRLTRLRDHARPASKPLGSLFGPRATRKCTDHR